MTIDDHIGKLQKEAADLTAVNNVTERNQKIEAIVKRELAFNETLQHHPKEQIKAASPRIDIWFHLVESILKLYQPTEKVPDLISDAFRVFGIRTPLYLSLAPLQLQSICDAKESVSHPDALAPAGSQTANGVYFLDQSFVVKPIAQEEGCLGNPQGHIHARKEGFKAGQGAIRERLAFNLQERLKCDFGVPFTEVVELEHPLLSEDYGIAQNIATLLKGYFNITADIDFKGAESRQQLFQRIIDYIEPQNTKASHLIRDLLIQQPTSKGRLLVLAKKYQIDFQMDNELFTVATTLISLFQPSKPSPPLCSMQAFIPSKSYGHFSPSQLAAIPDQEMHKCIFDLVSFNADRHMNNILFEKKSEDELGVVLIDHGLCFPDLKQAVLEGGPRFEWVALPQFNNPLAEPFATVFANLDIEELIQDLRADQALFEMNYPEQATLDEGVYTLLRLNLLLVQTGARLGCSVEAMALFLQPIHSENLGGEVQDIFTRFIADKTDIDWESIGIAIEEILKTPIQERTR